MHFSWALTGGLQKEYMVQSCGEGIISRSLATLVPFLGPTNAEEKDPDIRPANALPRRK